MKPATRHQNPTKTIYVYGDGAVWKLSPADVRAIARDKSWGVRGKQTSAHRKLLKRSGNDGAWRNLPTALYADERGRLSAWSPEVEVFHYDDEDALVDACERASTAPRRNPSTNDPGLTVAKLKLRRRAPGVYEHVNRATGTTWGIYHRTGEYRGENAWVYIRTDDAAWSSSENRAHDTFSTKADAVEALVEHLRGRYHHPTYGWTTA